MSKEPIRMARPPYRLFEHTADLGVEIYGTDEGDLFRNAAGALLDILTDARLVHARDQWEICAEGGDPEELLVNFLREILYKFNGEGLLLKECVISEIGNNHVKGTVKGEPFVPGRHGMNMEIKAVTYHGTEIRKTDEGWTGRVVLDV